MVNCRDLYFSLKLEKLFFKRFNPKNLKKKTDYSGFYPHKKRRREK